MREIKFRAWDGIEMLDIYQIQTRASGIAVYYLKGGFFNGRRLTKIDNPLLMQYTGLKDKNGNDVYEGDLLHNDDPEYGVGVIEFSSKYNGWILNDNYDETGADDLTVILNNDYKIIGNIYENPELLNNG